MQICVAALLVLILGTLLLFPLSHIQIEIGFFWKVSVGVGVMQLLAVRYRRQQEWSLVAALNGASLLIAFSTVYAATQYLLPEHNPVFWDSAFARFDEALGLTSLVVVEWTRSVPHLDMILAKIYYAFFFHFALYVPYAAGVRRDPWRMYETLANMFVSAIFGLVLFAIFPAKNAIFFYGIEDIHHTGLLVQHLDELSKLDFGLLTPGNAQGLIQFPSFHVAIAVLLCWDLRYEVRPVLIVGIIWTALMAWSAITTGGHYVIDIWGGVAIAMAAIGVVRWLSGSKPQD